MFQQYDVAADDFTAASTTVIMRTHFYYFSDKRLEPGITRLLVCQQRGSRGCLPNQLHLRPRIGERELKLV